MTRVRGVRPALAWQARGSNAHELLAAENDFMREHPTTWVPAFCESVRQGNNITLYAGLADIIEGWLLYDQEVIAEVVGLGTNSMGPVVENPNLSVGTELSDNHKYTDIESSTSGFSL